MKTIYQVEIDHTKPLPSKVPLTDVIADRIYNYCFAQGVEVGVKANVHLTPKEEKDAN